MESTVNPDRELSSLNRRFSDYLHKIQRLVQINGELHRQVENAYENYFGISQYEKHSELNHLRDKLENEVRQQTLISIRCQRADYEREFYLNALKILPVDQTKEIQEIEDKFRMTREEFERLRHEFQRNEENVRLNKNLYEETLKNLFEFTNQYDRLIFERMENQHQLCTLKEKIAFENELHKRRHEDLAQLDVFKDFQPNEFNEILERIREDYRQFNAIRQNELEKLYKSKLERIRHDFDEQKNEKTTSKPKDFLSALNSSKKERRDLIEENRTLNSKLEQFERNFNEIIDENHQNYSKLNREYRQLEIEIPELDRLLVDLRSNAVSLCSEIQTYRYLLSHLVSETIRILRHSTCPNTTPGATDSMNEGSVFSSLSWTKHVVQLITSLTNEISTPPTAPVKEKKSRREYRDEKTGLIVHIEDGLIWVRI